MEGGGGGVNDDVDDDNDNDTDLDNYISNDMIFPNVETRQHVIRREINPISQSKQAAQCSLACRFPLCDQQLQCW